MPTRLGVIGLAVFFAAAIGLTWKAQSWRYGALIAANDKAQAMAVSQAYEKVRLIEKQRQEEMEVIRNDATLQIMEIQTDADTANHTAERLRQELARYRANAANTCTAAGSEAAQDPIGVLIGVLEGLESTGREIAEYADRSRIAGSACERAYDSLKDAKKPHSN